MKAFAAVRHVSFDLWLTIIKSHPSFKTERSRLLKRHFDIQKTDGEVFETVTRFDRLFNQVNETTGGNVTTFEIVLVILDALGHNPQQVSAIELNGFYEAMEALFFKYPPVLLHSGIPQYLQQLRQSGRPVSLLSNTAFIKGSTLDRWLQQNGLSACFDFRLYSDEIGHSKPAPQVFEQLLQRAQTLQSLTAGDILHIGDNKKADYDGALAAGMQARIISTDGAGWPLLFEE
jgi:putative hydrolase of the HAD superfamily